jgi:hypothetical protein
MKTTVHIPDALLAEARKLARESKTTLRALVSEGLSEVLESRRAAAKPVKLKDYSYPPKGKAGKPATPIRWEEIRAIVYEGRGE